MLVTFQAKACADITMFGEVAVKLLRLMGHSGRVPGALEPEDIPAALTRLKAAAAEKRPVAEDNREDDPNESDERPVSLIQRAYPLVQLLEAAEKERATVTWE